MDTYKWNGDNVKKMWKHYRLDTYDDLCISDYDIDDNAAKYIAYIIKNNKQLKKSVFVNLSINLKIISKGLKYSTCLEKLYLWHMKCINLKYIANTLKYNQSLKCIYIKYSTIDNNTLKSFGKMLKDNNTLESIKFIYCDIDDKGCKYISQGLKYNKSLKSITLSSNKITEKGFKYICDSVRHNKYLRKLSIGYDNESNKGYKYTYNLLKCNKYLENFAINYGYTDLKGQILALKALKLNDTLKKFKIEHFLLDGSSSIDVEHIYNILKYNKSITIFYNALWILDNPLCDDEYTHEDILCFIKINKYIDGITNRNKNNIVQRGVMLLDLL